MQKWTIETSSLSLKISQWDREKLWDSWQEDVSSNKKTRKLKKFIRWQKIQVWGLDRLQELGIFHESIEIKL